MKIKNPKKRIYIAGPMRGYPQYNYPAFNAADEWLTLQGWEVKSPAKISKTFGTPSAIDANPYLLARLMRYEIEVLEKCDAIYLLRGWEKSVGAKEELAVALREGLEIIVQGGGEE